VSAHPSIEQLSALIDGELSLVAREAVSAHLRDCPTCAGQHQELVEVAAQLAAMPAASWAAEMTAEVLERAAAGPRERVAAVRGRDWTLAIAAALALIGVAAVALAAPFPAASLLDGLRLNVFAAFAAGAGLPFGGFLAVLVLLPALGLLAVPLLRQR
jgi:anti-sigma factor RsiW